MFNKLILIVTILLIMVVSFVITSAQSISELPISITDESHHYHFEDGALLLRYACQFGNVQEACRTINFTLDTAQPAFEDGALLLRYACQFGNVQEACRKLN